MKKRFFAGLLACLMVVGLLPLSMLLKPVSAKADDVSSGVHVFYPSNMDDIAKNGANKNKIIWSDDFFKLYGHGSLRVEASEKSFKDNLKCTKKLTTGGSTSVKISGNDYTAAACVSFDVEGSAQIKIWWAATDTKRKLAVYNGTVSGSSDEDNMIFSATADGKDVAMISTTTISSESKKTYFIGGTNGLYIYKIEVTEETSKQPQPTETKYDVTVIDSATTETTGKVNSKSEGETFTLKAADTTNFLYWVNSYGRIVSRDAEYSFPVYYSDTYTAVYKSAETVVKYMTAYDQVLSEVKLSSLIKTDGTVDETVIPSNPVRYGYTFSKWSKTAEEIQAEATAGEKSIEVKPEYTLDTTTYDVTINGVTEKNQPVNKIITAKSSLGDKFAYWADSNNNKLSYNPTYSFFVNDVVNIKEVSTDDIDRVEAEGIITCVKQDAVDGKSIVIFEYSVPEDCTIKFAGVVADTSESNLSMSKAKFVGGESTSYKEYRYTLTNASGVAYKVKAVLKYVDKNNELQERESTVYTLN